jgi:hypothetical protein
VAILDADDILRIWIEIVAFRLKQAINSPNSFFQKPVVTPRFIFSPAL